MKAYEHILSKQIEWMHNNEVTLIGSKGHRGRLAYTLNIDDNLFQPLTSSTKISFQRGDGNELSGNPAKMQAVHSSSALAVNIFQYWQNIDQAEKIAFACGFCRQTTKISKEIEFEVKYSISKQFGFSPNIDVVIKNEATAPYKVFAIECKFTEAYAKRGDHGLKEKYIDLNVWDEIPHLHQLAQLISPTDTKFKYLHSAQLIKHILGLNKAYGKSNFRLLYLWYDTFGNEGAIHKNEISDFIKIARTDGIAIHEMSYQKLIAQLAKNFRTFHEEYIKYITSRYL